MAMMKGALVGAALGALALATVLFVAPIAAQDPGGPAPSGPDRRRGPDLTGETGPRMSDPYLRGQRRDMGPDRDTGPGAARRPIDPNDPDITGPRGEFSACQERLAQMAQRRLERIQRLTRPTEDQRAAFEELKMASTKALDVLRQACPSEQPLTPPARMAAMEKWLEARLQASKTVRPALEAYYRLLSDEQKIRWVTGPRTEAPWGGRWERWQSWSRQDRQDLQDMRPPDTWPPGGWPPSGAEDRGRDRGPDGWRGPRRDPAETWDERGRDSRDGRDGRFGFDRGERSDRGGERYRFRDDDRGGRDDRWRDQDRGRWPDQRWREQRWRDDEATGGFRDRR